MKKKKKERQNLIPWSTRVFHELEAQEAERDEGIKQDGEIYIDLIWVARIFKGMFKKKKKPCWALTLYTYPEQECREVLCVSFDKDKLVEQHEAFKVAENEHSSGSRLMNSPLVDFHEFFYSSKKETHLKIEPIVFV